MSQLAASPSYEYVLKIISGPDRGASFKILSNQITIGRDKENHIQINDRKVSRKHALIRFSNSGIKIQELSEHSRMTVNGKKTKQAMLTDRTKFTLGTTDFLFKVITQNKLPAKQSKNSSSRKQRSNSSDKKSLMPIYLIVGAILAFLLFSETSKKNKEEVEIRDEKAIEETIKNNEKVLEELEKQYAKSGVSSKDFKRANILFKRGFRDFKHGIYEQALTSFQACLSIYSKHQLCERYQFLSRRKLDELLQYNMILGRRYLEQNQFKQCIHAFKNIMLMVKNRKSKIYQEAYSNLKTCQKRYEGGL